MIFKPQNRILWLLSLLAGSLLSCEPEAVTGAYQEKLVVFGNLEANTVLKDPVYVSLSASIDEPHEGEGKWISDATVILATADTAFYLSPVPDLPGGYSDLRGGYIIMPKATYRLEVEWKDYRVTAATRVPDKISLQSVTSTDWECEGEGVMVKTLDLTRMDTVTYREGPCYTTSFMSAPLFVIRWDSPTDPGLVRVVSLALNDLPANAIVDTSLSATLFKGPMYLDADGRYFRLNPAVWNLSQRELHFGWLSFNYYGPHRILIQAADRSFWDYYQGDPLGMNQYILPRGNIEGGYGLFSSTNTSSFSVYIKPEEPLSGQ